MMEQTVVEQQRNAGRSPQVKQPAIAKANNYNSPLNFIIV
jgi:hypothetical protein